MSYFIGNSSQYSYADVDPEKIKIAEMQFNAVSATFNKVIETCQKKCIPDRYGEGELNTGEQCCLDRCVTKYVKANLIVGSNFQEKGATPYEDMGDYIKIRNKLEEVSKVNGK